jgi:hypothetical protein
MLTGDEAGKAAGEVRCGGPVERSGEVLERGMDLVDRLDVEAPSTMRGPRLAGIAW